MGRGRRVGVHRACPCGLRDRWRVTWHCWPAERRARRVGDGEHRAALDWLNNATTSGFNFFGLEIELWKIGDSAMAPKFNIVSKPNDWTKTVREQAAAREAGPLSDFQRLHLEFWTQFRQYLEDRGSPIRITRPSKNHWSNVPVGRTDFGLNPWNGMRDNRSAVDFSMTGRDAKAHFGLLEQRYRDVVQQRLAPLGTLEWRQLPNAKESQIRVIRASTPSKPETWPELDAWMANTLEVMHALFAPIVKTLNAVDFVPPAEDSQATDL